MYRYKILWRQKGLPVFVWLSAATGVFGLSGCLYFQWLNLPPTAHIPSPVLPSPNGHDALARVADEEVQKDDVDRAGSKPYSAGPNLPVRVYTLAEKDALMTANAPTFAALHTALTLPYWNPPMRSASARMPEFAKFRRLARLLSFAAQVRDAHGDYEGAANSRIEAIKLGVTVPRGGVVIAHLVGNACESIGDRHLWDDIDRLSADQAADAARQLETIAVKRVPYADTEQEEKWYGQAALIEALKGKSTFAALTDLSKYTRQDGDYDYSAEQTKELAALYRPLLTHSKRRIFADLTTLHDAYIDRARQQYCAQQPEIPLPDDPFNQMLSGEFQSAHFKDDIIQMQSNLLTTAFALRAYRLRQGHYPASLDDLVTTHILSHVPSDPFASAFHVPFHYRPLPADKYLLYSVGPDGRDDGGRPIPAKGNDTESRYRSQVPWQGDQGDWVVGVNVGAR